MSGANYSRALARVAVAQIAELAGFDAAHESAVDILADLLQRYLSSVCASAHDYAELAGRTHTNTMDTLLALEDMGVTPDELDVFCGLALQGSNPPFPHVVARYPVMQQQPSAPTFLDRHEPHPQHIPAHFPAFPDTHTYQHTPAFQGHEPDAQRQRQAVLASKQQAEAALVKLHQRLVAAAAATAVAGPTGGAARGGGENPFLAPPVVVDTGDATSTDLLEPGMGGGTAIGDEANDLDALDFDASAAQRVFQRVLAPADQQQQQQHVKGEDGALTANGGGRDAAAMMDVDGQPAPPPGGAEGQWVLWAPDSLGPPAADATGSAGLRRQELLQLQWHDPAKALSVLGASSQQRPPDAYQERAEAAMAAEGAGGGGGRQRKSAYGRGNADLQRADELLRAGHAAGGAADMDDDAL